MSDIKQLIEWNAPQPKTHNLERLWDRQPFDSERQWAAYRVYLMQPMPRSVERLHKTTGIPLGTLTLWSKKNHWVNRALVLDNHIHNTWTEKVETYIEKRAEDYVDRHAAVLTDAFTLLQTELKKYLEVSQGSDMPGLLRPSDLIRLMEVTVKLERLHYGESTENIASKVDLSGLTIEQLRDLKELNSKVGMK